MQLYNNLTKLDINLYKLGNKNVYFLRKKDVGRGGYCCNKSSYCAQNSKMCNYECNCNILHRYFFIKEILQNKGFIKGNFAP